MKNSFSPPSVRLAVVDAAPEDYSDLLAAVGGTGVSLHFLASANDALLFAKRWLTGLWVINTHLSDMSGFELAEMLRALKPNSLVFMIGDDYALDEELQALTLGLAKYLCKPLEPSWVLPQTEKWCIPLPGSRATQRAATAATKQLPSASRRAQSATAIRVNSASPEQVIVPFGGSPEQRPAA